MQKYVGQINGNGYQSEFEITHGLGTIDFVYDIRTVNGGDNGSYTTPADTHDILGTVISTDNNRVLLIFSQPLDVEEILVITIIG